MRHSLSVPKILCKYCDLWEYIRTAYCSACDNSIAFLDCRGQRTSSSNHLSSLKTSWKDNLVEWSEPENSYFQYKKHSACWNSTTMHAWILSSDTTSICYLALWSWLHRCFNHLMRTSTNCLYSITIRGIIHSIWWPPTFPINLSFKLLHSLNKSSLLIVRPFSRLLCVSKNLQKKKGWCTM